MNVAFDPWIPVLSTAGESKLASLAEVFTESNNFTGLSVRPHERVSLMRLFICVAHAALDGPKNYNEWLKTSTKLPEAVRRYLRHWKDSFELFHPEKPWLQIAQLSKSNTDGIQHNNIIDWVPVSKLKFSYATGNNTTLFDHDGMNNDRRISIEETLLSMLTFQCFSPGGLISQVYWNGLQSIKSSKDAPCVTASMIHAFLRASNLLGSILLNLPNYEDIVYSYGNRQTGRPVWEKMPESQMDSTNIKNATETYIGRLVPITRLILLHPSGERMLLGDGLVYPVFTNGFPQEPTATVVIRMKDNKEERSLLSFHPQKALWRELSAIVVKRNVGSCGGPLSLRSIQDKKDCDLIVAALSRDHATIVDTIESVFHIPAKLRTTAGHSSYETEVRKAEFWASRLGRAVEEYRRGIDGGWKNRLKCAGSSKGKLKAKLHSLATIHYWTSIEKNLPQLIAHIEAIGTDSAMLTRNIWRKMLFSTACNSYKLACGQETPSHIRAFVKGWQKLTSMKDEETMNSTETMEEES